MTVKKDSNTGVGETSRRHFLRSSALGVGAVAAASASASSLAADLGEVEIPSISLAADFSASLEQETKPGVFTGRGQSGDGWLGAIGCYCLSVRYVGIDIQEVTCGVPCHCRSLGIMLYDPEKSASILENKTISGMPVCICKVRAKPFCIIAHDIW